MVNTAEGGSGGGDVAGRVDGLITEIEGLVGQLRGIEDSWTQLTAPLQDWERQEAENPAVPSGEPVWRTFHFRGDHPFTVDHLVPGGAAGSSGRTDPAGDRIQAAMDDAFDSARNSGNGALDFSRYVLTQVVEPDLSALRSAAHTMDEVALWLGDFTNDAVPTFVTTLRASWPPTSDSSESFYRFYDFLAHHCTQYYIGAARLAGVTAGVATVVQHYQQTLVTVLESGRDQLTTALETWQKFTAPEQVVTIERPGKDGAADKFGGLSLAAGILSLIPGAGLGVGAVSAVAGILSYAVGDDDVTTSIETVMTVVDIIGPLNEDLVGLRHEMGDALDILGEGGPGFDPLGAYVADTLINPLWVTPEVDLG